MWDINTGECLHVLMGHVAAVRCVQYDGRLVVSGAYDYMVNYLFLTFFCLENPKFDHTRRLLLAGYSTIKNQEINFIFIFQVKVWNPETEECLHTLSGHTNRVYSLQFDGIHVVSGSLDTSIRVWDVETGNF